MSDMAFPGSLATEFIRLLVDCGALLTGNFVLKSGKHSTYFIDFGRIPDGKALERLGHCYARKIVDEVGPSRFDLLFGPAYKGIPICVASVMSLHRDYGLRKGCTFNRKTAKKYGEKSLFLGAGIETGSRVLIVDDVMSDGGTKYETVQLLRESVGAHPMGVLVGVDRTEDSKIRREFSHRTGLPVWSITTIEEIRTCLKQPAETENDKTDQMGPLLWD